MRDQKRGPKNILFSSNCQIKEACLKTSLILVVTAASTAGCAKFSSFTLESDRSIVLEAEQRTVNNVPIKETSRPGRPDPKRIVCAEPSPDTSRVLSQSISFAAKLADKGDLALSRDSAQAIVQLAERTTSVQLLRDQMHRACEAYSNGAISGTTYTMIMSRNNDAMVTLMLGENAAGAFGRSGAAVAGKSSSEAKAKFDGASASFEQAINQQTKAEAELIKAQEALELAQSNSESADKLVTEDGSDANKEKAAEAKENLKQAQANFNAAKALRDKAVENVLASSDLALKASAEITAAQGQGGLTNAPSVGIANTLADIQSSYLNRSSISDFISTCMVELGQNFVPAKGADGEDLVGGISAEPYFWDLFVGEIKGFDKGNDIDFTRYHSVLNAERQTWLSEFCWSSLDDMLRKEQKNRFLLDQQEKSLRNNLLIARANEASAQKISSTQKAISECGKLDDDERKLCMNTIAKTVDSKAISLPLKGKIDELSNPIFPEKQVALLKLKIQEVEDLADKVSKLKIRQPKDKNDKNKEKIETLESDYADYVKAKALVSKDNPKIKAAENFTEKQIQADNNTKTIDGPLELEKELLELQSQLFVEQNLDEVNDSKVLALRFKIKGNQEYSKVIASKISSHLKELSKLESEYQSLENTVNSYHEVNDEYLKQ
ncbi:MAG: hypothetical protein AAF434_12605 [Pseudomonadota bacterium]